ncbi:hypothetical protein AVEN_65622-1, partial [Araneus ventricosus]
APTVASIPNARGWVLHHQISNKARPESIYESLLISHVRVFLEMNYSGFAIVSAFEFMGGVISELCSLEVLVDTLCSRGLTGGVNDSHTIYHECEGWRCVGLPS